MGRAIKPSGKRAAQPSMKVVMAQQKQKMMAQGLMPDDVGLLDGTFIMPRGKNLPSWFGNFAGRRTMEWRRFKIRLREVVSALVYRWWMVRPRPRLHIMRIPSIAKDLHKTMYTQFASGNLAPVEQSICAGLLGSLRARISQRPPNTELKWTLHQYLSKPKLVSYKAAVVPAPRGQPNTERNAIIQAVVRIHSLQSLQHVKRVTVRGEGRGTSTKEVIVDAQGREIAEPAVDAGAVPKDAKESVEYFVVQKMLRKGKEGPWMVWGSAEETTLDKLRKAERAPRQDLLAAKASA